MIKALHTFPFLRPLVTAHGEGTGTSRIPGEMTRYGFCENSGKGVGCHRRGNDGADPVMSPFSPLKNAATTHCILLLVAQLAALPHRTATERLLESLR